MQHDPFSRDFILPQWTPTKHSSLCYCMFTSSKRRKNAGAQAQRCGIATFMRRWRGSDPPRGATPSPAMAGTPWAASFTTGARARPSPPAPASSRAPAAAITSWTTTCYGAGMRVGAAAGVLAPAGRRWPASPSAPGLLPSVILKKEDKEEREGKKRESGPHIRAT